MEGGSIPPDVLRQFAGDGDDEDQNNNTSDDTAGPFGNSVTSDWGSSNNSNQGAAHPLGDDSNQGSSGNDWGGDFGAEGSDQYATSQSESDQPGVDQPKEPGESIGWREQLKMLAPHGWLHSFRQLTGTDQTEEQTKAQQQKAQQHAQIAMHNQQEAQQEQQSQEAKKAQVRQQLAEIQAQAKGLPVESGSVLNSLTGDASAITLNLAQRALKDAQQAKMRQEEAGSAMPRSATKKGPRSMSDTISEESGFQRLAEQTMGE